jgi:hypothetical protein
VQDTADPDRFGVVGAVVAEDDGEDDAADVSGCASETGDDS